MTSSHLSVRFSASLVVEVSQSAALVAPAAVSPIDDRDCMASEADSRGFSFMGELTSDVGDLKIIESSELDRTWKTTIRERQRVQERKIWEEFCNNEDVLEGILQDDPYQFLKDVPESYLELLDESEKLKKSDQSAAIVTGEENTHLAGGDNPLPEDQTIQLADDRSPKDTNALYLPLNTDQRGTEDGETSHDIQSPCTVREVTSRSLEFTDSFNKDSERAYTERSAEHNEIGDSNNNLSAQKEGNYQGTEKLSTKNVEPKKRPSSFEANIYFERVKSLRLKINEVLHCIIELLQEQVYDDYDPFEIKKLQKRANEFSSRFSRIYVYQLQRQLNDLQRHMSISLPFAKRTQFQAQSTRVVSLHHNTLQALQVFHRPLEKALCLGDGTHLQALLDFVRETSFACREIMPSQELKQKVYDMYNDEILVSCNKIERLMKRHMKCMKKIIETAEYSSPLPSARRKPVQKKKQAKRTQHPYGQKMGPPRRDGRNSPKYATGARLSMYSLDNVRVNLKPTAATDKAMSLDKGTDKPGSSLPQTNVPSKTSGGQKVDKKSDISGPSKKSSAGARKPLMRDNSVRAPPRKRSVPEEDIQTMVETVRGNSPKPKSGPEKSASVPAEVPKTTASPRPAPEAAAAEAGGGSAAGCDVTALLRRLCGGEAKEPARTPATNRSRAARVSGARNAQLVCVTRESPAASPRRAPRAPATTPQLLKILEENIQKQPLAQKAERAKQKSPTKRSPRQPSEGAPDKLFLSFNVPEQTTESIVNYRTQFVQYMMASPMYANSTFKKPWETVGRVSEQIIEELLLSCAKEMQIESVLEDLCHVEVNH